MKNFVRIIISVSVIFFIKNVSATCHPEVPRNKPDVIYKDYSDGTVMDTKTRLIWQKCSMGQAYISGSCTGNAIAYTWDGAMTAAQQANSSSMYGHNDWRVPSIKELFSLVDLSCDSPAINATVFPNTITQASYRTSTLKIPAADPANQSAMVIDFSTGSLSFGRATSLRYLRLVRN